MNEITKFRGGCLYVRIDELDIQVTDTVNSVGYITWSTLELIISHATQNNQEVALRDSIEVIGELEHINCAYKVQNLLDYRRVDDDGFYVQLDTI